MTSYINNYYLTLLLFQLTKRNVFHQGLQVESNATGLVLKLIQLPTPTKEIGTSSAWNALMKRLLSASIRVLSKGVVKSWMVEFVFYSTPLSSTHPKEQGKINIINLLIILKNSTFFRFKASNLLSV